MRSPGFAYFRFAIVGFAVFAISGCIAGYWTYNSAGGGREAANGEQHDTPYSAQDTLVITEDVLRGEGVLFEVKPDSRIVTLWRPADTPASMFASMAGVKPQYRYEIEVVPTGTRSSRIVANVATEDIADNEVDSYLPTKKLDLFQKFDQYAAQFPPPSSTPREGGVNFALLPGEDLKALAKRATGNPDNWLQIAKDNGLTSSSDLSSVQSVWISNTLLSEKKGASPAP
ncbi:MAG: hypothetical protein ACLQAT_02620 [Candidatus Binataceae bacterium]